MIRDDEIERLINYAKGLGCTIKIKYKKYHGKHSTVAEMEMDTNTIYLYKTPRCSKIHIIFTLIHEIAHYKGFIERKRRITKTEDYIYDRYNNDNNAPLYIRKRVYNDEKYDMKYWNEIIKHCNIKISPKRVKMQKELDLLWYKLYVKYGYNFTDKHLKEEKNKIKQKYRGL